MKKKLGTMILGAALVMGLAACGGGSDSSDSGSSSGGGQDTASAGGQKIYDQKCSSCHGGDLKGGMGPDLSKIGAKYSKDEILKIAENGKTGDKGTMPPGIVSGDDAEQVAQWLSEKK
ncbi:cytochrome c551 [Neobacillus mesonae]|uniref:cytochrome c551 n=1 Tax=Neobacillus mesonae TaxID=1193713 RepID=UPI00203B0338|nr:cytochrome c [Neobacillus mesonae]MCM3567409.1 cytochrome c [Neobacillus mesonae]